MKAGARIDRLLSLHRGSMARSVQVPGIELACCDCSHDSGRVGKTVRELS